MTYVFKDAEHVKTSIRALFAKFPELEGDEDFRIDVLEGEPLDRSIARLNAFGNQGWEPVWAPQRHSGYFDHEKPVPYRFYLKREVSYVSAE